MNLFVDSDHARDTKTRKSISCILAALLGVLFDWHMGKQSCIAAHSTDAEVRATTQEFTKTSTIEYSVNFSRFQLINLQQFGRIISQPLTSC